MKKLVFLPTGPLSDYQDIGYDGIYDYYNPLHYFDEVICVSPYKEKYDYIQGIKVVAVKSYSQYKKIIEEINPLVVRVYGTFYSADYANYYRVGNVPLITSVHDVINISPSIRNSDKVICMTEIVRDKVVSMGVDYKKTVVMPNRIDINKFNNKRGIKETVEIRKKFPNGKMILCVARLSIQKNIDNIVKAIKYLPKDYFCVFVGAGNDAYKKLSFEEKVDNRCFWIHSVNNSQLPFWYSAADCFCLPSRWEGFGIVFLEAAACELPIITSDIAPMNEFLSQESAMMIKEYENPAKIAEAIIYACTTNVIEDITNNAKKLLGKFEKNKIDCIEIGIYKEVICNSKKIDIAQKDFDKLDLAIWGAGNNGKIVYEYMISKGYKINYFVDNNKEKQNNIYCGLEVVSSEKIDNETIIVPNNYFQDVYENVDYTLKSRLVDFNAIKAKYCEL